MRVLLIGSGGREHALAWKLGQSERLAKLFIAPGNAGTAEAGDNVALDAADHAAVVDFCRRERIDLVVVGPEAPLVAGIADDLRAAGIAVFGPSKAAARLEGSKAFAKAFCDEFGIPTARWRRFTDAESARAYLAEHGAPIVVKADGLAAGKGVIVAETVAEAEAAITACLTGAFGAAGASLVLEERLEGEEVSLFAVSDGTDYVLLPPAQDHKRAHDGDRGPNTGGMGAYSPTPLMSPALIARAESEIVAPTLAGMRARATPFTGVLFAGLMLTAQGPKLIEYNVRFGDPECQVLMMRLESDLLELLWRAAAGRLAGYAPQWRSDVALTVVMAAEGYPGPYIEGSEIRGLEGLDSTQVRVFHAGTSREAKRLVATGGRVLNVTALGRTVEDARSHAYRTVDQIDWPQGFCRRDIGWRAGKSGGDRNPGR